MTEAIVDELEFIDVDDKKRQRTTIALKSQPLSTRQGVEMAAVNERGQTIGGSEHLEIVDKLFGKITLPYRLRQPSHQQHADHKAAGCDINQFRYDEKRRITQKLADARRKEPIFA